MRLISLVTENFKKLGSTTVNFTNGLNIIAGDNAKGKSTLLQALEAAFFGVTVVPGKKENIPTWGQKKFSLALIFEAKGDTYLLERTATSAKLTRQSSGELVANGTTPVTAFNEELLGLASRDYNLFVQTKQGESSGILTFGAAALNRKVEEFAGVDLIDKIQARATQKAAALSSGAEAKKVSQDDLDVAETDSDARETNFVVSGHDLRRAKEALEAYAPFAEPEPTSSAKLRAEKDAAAVLANKLELAEKARDATQATVDDSKARCEKLKLVDVTELGEQLASLKEQGTQLATAHKALEAKEGEYKRAHDKFIAADSTFDEGSYDAEAGKLDLDKAQADLGEAETKLDTLTEAVGTTKAAYDSIKALASGATCPTCGHAKDDHDPVKLAQEADNALKAWENAKAVVSTARQALAQLKATITELTGKADAYASAKQAYVSASVALNALQEVTPDVVEKSEAAVNEVRGAYAKVKAQLDAADESNAAHKREHSLLKSRQEKLEVETEVAQLLDQQWADLPEPPTAEQVAAAEAEEGEYRAAKTAWAHGQSVLAAAVTTTEQTVKHNEELLKSSLSRLEALKARNKEAADDQARADKYSRLVRFLRDQRQAYLKEVWDTIMGVSSRLVRQASSGLITKVANTDGDFFFEEEGILAPTSSASGAQRSFIGVALRVGLARALYGSDSLMIFDEPTEACSERNASGMAAMLASSAKQVLLITHRETDQMLADNIINVGE